MTAFEETAEAVVKQGTIPSAAQLEALQGANADVDVASEQLAGIVPHGEKWWRYGYEYVFVQCLLMNMVLLTLAAVFGLLAYYKGEYLGISRGGAKYSPRHGMTLHQKWFEELSSMMTVTAIVALLVLGVFFYMEEAVMDFTPKVLAAMGAAELRVPHTKAMFEDILVSTIVYLLVVCLVYYLLMHVLVGAAAEKKAHWADLDSRLIRFRPREGSVWTPRTSKDLSIPVPTDGASSKTSSATVSRQSSKEAPEKSPLRHRETTVFNRKMSLFDEDVQRFGAIRDYVVEHLLDDESPLHEAVQALQDPPSEELIEKFRLSWYFRLAIDDCIVKLVTIGTMTWVFLILLFTVLGAGAALWGWTYLHMMVLIGLMCTLVLGSMYYLSRKQFQHLEAMMTKMDKHDESHLPNIRTETMLEAMRCSTLLLIYGAVQFIGSAFVWKYYFYANLLFCVFVAAALLLWCLSWVQIIPVYAAANSLGPMSSPEMAKLHAENVRASLQDDEDWAAAEDEAAAGVIASPRPGSAREYKK